MITSTSHCTVCHQTFGANERHSCDGLSTPCGPSCGLQPPTANDFRAAMQQANDIVREQRERIAKLARLEVALAAALQEIVSSHDDPDRMRDIARKALRARTGRRPWVTPSVRLMDKPERL